MINEWFGHQKVVWCAVNMVMMVMRMVMRVSEWGHQKVVWFDVAVEEVVVVVVLNAIDQLHRQHQHCLQSVVVWCDFNLMGLWDVMWCDLIWMGLWDVM